LALPPTWEINERLVGRQGTEMVLPRQEGKKSRDSEENMAILAPASSWGTGWTFLVAMS
jgi:hypothetical protein